MWSFQKASLLPQKIYLKAMLWANGFFLAAWVCCLSFKREFLSPLESLAISIALVICYLIGLYKHPKVNQATKNIIWWWEFPLFFAGFIFAATRESAAFFLFLWGFLYGNGVFLLKYKASKKVEGKLKRTALK